MTIHALSRAALTLGLGIAVAIPLSTAPSADAATLNLTQANQYITPGTRITASISPGVSTFASVYACLTTAQACIPDGVSLPDVSFGSGTVSWTMPASLSGIPFGSSIDFIAYYGGQGTGYYPINSQGGPEFWTTTAPAISQAQLTAGKATGTTQVLAVPNDSTDTLVVSVASTPVAAPDIGTELPSGTSPYTSGTDISGVKSGDYIDLYEISANKTIAAFSQLPVSPSDIATPPAWNPPSIVPTPITIAGKQTETLGNAGLNSNPAVQAGTYTGFVEERSALESGVSLQGTGIQSAYLWDILSGSGVALANSVVSPTQQGQFAALYQRLGVIPTWTGPAVSPGQGTTELLATHAPSLAIENYLVECWGFSWSSAMQQASAGFPLAQQ